MKVHRISIGIPDDLYEEITAAALFERRSISSMAVRILEVGSTTYRQQVTNRFYGNSAGAGAGRPAGAGAVDMDAYIEADSLVDGGDEGAQN